MKFENVRVYNFEGALRGMRNPKESWHLSDSQFGFEYLDAVNILINDTAADYIEAGDCDEVEVQNYFYKNGIIHVDGELCEYACIGPKDMKLAQTLIKAGSEHRKFMREIMVSVDITAPLYWWKEFDTYKVGTVANSTSTMHKLASTPINIDCFEIDDWDMQYSRNFVINDIIPFLEKLRQKYLETKDKKYWKELIRWLPESWLQTRTVTMTYENLYAMCSSGQRRFHKLTEWSGDGENFTTESFIKFARKLPYASDLIFLDEGKSILDKIQ